MAFKLIIFSALLAIAHAGNIFAGHYGAPVAYPSPAVAHVAPAPFAYAAPAVVKVATPVLTKHIDEEYDPNPQYSYAYDVQDSITGDNKQQNETRNGDSVQGSYSFIEADGTRRIVEYTADPVNGFNAVIHKEPAAAPVLAKAPLAYAAPVPVLAHAAPAHLAYAAPVAKLATPLYH